MSTSDDIRALNDIVVALTGSLEGLKEAMGSVADVSTSSFRAMRVDSLADSIAEMVEGAGSYEKRMRGIVATSKELRRAIREGTQDQAKSVEQMEKIAESARKLKGELRADSEEAKALDEILAACGGTTEAFVEHLSTASAKIDALGRKLESIDWKKPENAWKEAGNVLTGVLGTMSKLDSYGFKGTFGRLTQMREQTARMRKDLEESSKYKFEKYMGKHGATKEAISGLGAMKKSGIFNIADEEERKKSRKTLGQAYKAMGEGEGGAKEQAALVRTLSGRTGISGVLDRKLGKMALEAMGGGGGKMLGGLLNAGGGSVISGVIGKLAGPLSAIQTVLEVLQQGFDRQKLIYEKMGGGGLISGASPADLRDIYASWSDALEPSFKAGTLYGASVEKNLELMKEVVEAGVGVGGYANAYKKKGFTATLEGGPAQDIQSGIMRNAYIFGKPLGMSETEAARNTMKFMKEFSLSMESVENLFKKINISVRATGISTTAYLNLLSDVSSQFDKLNKSLGFTTNLILVLGKNAKYTTDDVTSMAKAVMGGKKDLTMATFAFSQMNEGQKAEFLGGQKKAEAEAFGGVQKLNIGAQTTMSDTELRSLVDKLEEGARIPATKEIERYIQQRRLTAGYTAAGGDALKMGAVSQAAETPEARIAQEQSILGFITKQLGFSPSDLTDYKKTAQMMADPRTLKMGEATGVNMADKFTAYGQAVTQLMSTYKTAAGPATNKEEREAKQRALDTLGLSEDDDKLKAIQKELAEGKKIEESNTMKSIVNSTSGFSQLSKVVAESADKRAKQLAEANQKYITGPMDFLSRLMTVLVDKITGIFRLMAESTIFGTSESRAVSRAESAYDRWSMGGKTEEAMGQFFDDVTKASSGFSEEEKTRVAKEIEESRATMAGFKKSGILDPEAASAFFTQWEDMAKKARAGTLKSGEATGTTYGSEDMNGVSVPITRDRAFYQGHETKLDQMRINVQGTPRTPTKSDESKSDESKSDQSKTPKTPGVTSAQMAAHGKPLTDAQMAAHGQPAPAPEATPAAPPPPPPSAVAPKNTKDFSFAPKTPNPLSSTLGNPIVPAPVNYSFTLVHPTAATTTNGTQSTNFANEVPGITKK